MWIACCVCGKEIKPRERIAVAYDLSAAVHLSRCCFQALHRQLTPRERLFLTHHLAFMPEKPPAEPTDDDADLMMGAMRALHIGVEKGV